MTLIIRNIRTRVREMVISDNTGSVDEFRYRTIKNYGPALAGLFVSIRFRSRRPRKGTGPVKGWVSRVGWFGVSGVFTDDKDIGGMSGIGS